jgi:hypothetical protein
MGTCDINSRNSFQLYCVYEIGNEEQKKFINEVQRFIERQNIRKYDYHICEYNEFRIKITFKDNRHLREEVIYDGVPIIESDNNENDNNENRSDVNTINGIINLIRRKTNERNDHL